ncbi:MAG: hypothetical protein WCV55_01050 [Candidatus Paceibacterota bacterium]
MYKLVTHVPLSHSDKVREAMANAGAGNFSHYSFCSFTTKGIGRFKGDENSNPAVGEKEKLMEVEEEKIEVILEEDKIKDVIKAIKEVHPYEEIPIEVCELEDIEKYK